MERLTAIDRAGRVVIPVDLRRQLHLRAGNRLRLRIENGRLILEPEEEEDAVVEEGGLLVAKGRLAGKWVDHHEILEDRLGRLVEPSER